MDHQTFAQLLGNYGEFFGAIAVVVTLIYLASQLRQNTKAMQSGTREAFLNGLQTTNVFALDHIDVWHRGTFEGEELAGEDFVRFLTVVHSAVNVYEALYSEYLAGNVEQAFWEGKERQMDFVFSTPSGRKAWYDYTHLFDERFVEYVNQNIAPKIDSQASSQSGIGG
jgi:hypothetical protein